MRFAIYVTLLLAVVPFVFWRPFFGLCAYYVVSLLQPKYLCWRPDFQDAMLVGIPLVVGAILIGVRRLQPVMDEPRVGATPQAPRFKSVRAALFEPAWPIIVLAALLIYITITRLFSEFPLEASSFQYRSLVKMFLVMALVTGMIGDFRRLRIFYIVVALAVGFWAIKGGLKVLLFGPHQVYGRTYDNNLFALTSAMVLPMVFYYALSVGRAWARNLLLVCSVLMCLAIIGSQSRAGFLALSVVLAGMAWTSRYRIRAVSAVVLLIFAVLLVSRNEVRERIHSIVAYKEDESARSRFASWAIAPRLLEQHPLTGVGFGNFETAKAQIEGTRKAAHNIYLQNLAELGLLGHPIWLLFVVGSWVSMLRFMRECRRLSPQFKWAYHWSRGLWLGMTAFCVHGLFHNEEYLELMFVMVALHVALRITARRELHIHRLVSVAAQATTPRLRRNAGHPGRRGLALLQPA